jgi:hypothetical protein
MNNVMTAIPILPILVPRNARQMYVGMDISIAVKKNAMKEQETGVDVMQDMAQPVLHVQLRAAKWFLQEPSVEME